MQERNALFKELMGMGIYEPNSCGFAADSKNEVNQEVPIAKSNKPDLRWVQISLNKIQQSNLQVDGVEGPKTTAAIRAFQQKQNLKVNGLIDDTLKSALINAGATAYSDKSVLKDTFPDVSPCNDYFKNMSDAAIEKETSKEKFYKKITGKSGSIDKYQGETTGYLLYDFDIDGWHLKEKHVNAINELRIFMDTAADNLASKGYINIKFTISIDGYTSYTYKNPVTEKHNCLLSRKRVKAAQAEIEKSYSISPFNKKYTVDYKLNYWGYSRTFKKGELAVSRAIKITISKPALEKAPVKLTGHIFKKLIGKGIPLDCDLADILYNLYLQHNSSFSHDIALFLHDELNDRNCEGAVKAANRNQLIGYVPFNLLMSYTSKSDVNEIDPHGFMGQFYHDAKSKGFIVVKNKLLYEAINNKDQRDFLSIVLAHEILHYRNRFVVNNLNSKKYTNYVDNELAGSFKDTDIYQVYFANELSSRHIAWHVKNELNSLPSEKLYGGVFFKYALWFANESIGSEYDNGYLKKLKAKVSVNLFNKQIANYMLLMKQFQFHSNITINNSVYTMIDEEYKYAVNTGFATPVSAKNGGA